MSGSYYSNYFPRAFLSRSGGSFAYASFDYGGERFVGGFFYHPFAPPPTRRGWSFIRRLTTAVNLRRERNVDSFVRVEQGEAYLCVVSYKHVFTSYSRIGLAFRWTGMFFGMFPIFDDVFLL
ncbi:hypothetical protein ACFE04_011144 [Oxalis oulophora]